jgi:GT2 family glycosyltransferase
MQMPKILVVIVTYNGMKWIEKCLESVNRSDVPVNVHVIDNGSSDGTQSFIANNFPTVEVVSNSNNLGFGMANNIGLKKAIADDFDYVFLLNQDGYVKENTISTLVNFNKRYPEYGVLSPLQLNGDGSAYDKNFEEYVLAKRNCINNITFGQFEKLYQVKFVMAAFWLISKSCLKRVGLFDPIFAHYGEDNDFLNRVRYHHFKIGILEKSVGYHDREFRNDNGIKKIKIIYASLLAQAIDINSSLLKCFVGVLYVVLKFSVISISKLDFRAFLENQKGLFLIVSKYKSIIESRKRNSGYYLR